MMIIWYMLIGLLVCAIYLHNFYRTDRAKHRSKFRRKMEKKYTEKEFQIFCFYLIYVWLPYLIAIWLYRLQTND